MQGRSLLLVLTLGLLFSLIVVGAYVAADPLAGEACGTSASWPLCNGSFFPTADPHVIAEYSHRFLALFSAVFLFVVAALFLRAKETPRLTRLSLVLASVFMLFQIGLGDVVVGADLNPALVALHQASALTIFGLVVAAFVARDRPG
jgi:cytochrome c oxidase assembly protein subunit 15